MDDELMAAFTKNKTQGLDGTVVIFTCGDFQIVASRQGVQFIGRSVVFGNVGELRDFAAVIDKAFKEHKTLIPAIVAPGSGH